MIFQEVSAASESQEQQLQQQQPQQRQQDVPIITRLTHATRRSSTILILIQEQSQNRACQALKEINWELVLVSLRAFKTHVLLLFKRFLKNWQFKFSF
jgi:hypothetical protein